jgi:hypothetical protein
MMALLVCGREPFQESWRQNRKRLHLLLEPSLAQLPKKKRNNKHQNNNNTNITTTNKRVPAESSRKLAERSAFVVPG